MTITKKNEEPSELKIIRHTRGGQAARWVPAPPLMYTHPAS